MVYLTQNHFEKVSKWYTKKIKRLRSFGVRVRGVCEYTFCEITVVYGYVYRKRDDVHFYWVVYDKHIGPGADSALRQHDVSATSAHRSRNRIPWIYYIVSPWSF